MSYIEVVKEVKKYTMGDTVIAANDGVSFSVEKGEIALILGCLLYTSPSPRDS